MFHLVFFPSTKMGESFSALGPWVVIFFVLEIAGILFFDDYT